MCRSRLWVGVVALILAGCTDVLTNPTRLPPDRANLAVTGAEEADGEVHLHFEGMADRWWVDVAFSFYRVGILLEGGLTAQIVGAEDYPGWGDPLEGLLPKASGSTVLNLGYVHGAWDPSGWPYNPLRAKYRFTLFDPVSEFSMVIYPENDSDLTCYDRQDRIVGTAFAAGAWSVGPGYTNFSVPYAEQTLKVAGAGITYCVLEALGGAIDDIRFRRSSNELNLSCTGDLGENRVTRGEELICEASGASEEDELEIESWLFTGADLHGQPYEFPGDMDTPITDNPWRGTMVISGTVSVRAAVNGGEVQEKSVPITVEPRSWDNEPIEATARKVTWAELPVAERPPPYPTRVSDLGTAYLYWKPAFGADFLDQISDFGPNHYLLYFKRVPARLFADVLVHPEMETRGDFWKSQASSLPAYSERPPCLQRDFDRYVSQILRHEGVPPNPESHAGVYIAEFSSRAGLRVEGLVDLDTNRPALLDSAVARLNEVNQDAYVLADSPVDARHKIPFGCDFHGIQR
jgi:hypothetical protein